MYIYYFSEENMRDMCKRKSKLEKINEKNYYYVTKNSRN